MADLDLGYEAAVKNFLSKVREHPLAKSLIDTACWDLRAQISDMPLWRRLGACDANVPISWTVTRAAPTAMAREAAAAANKHGIRAFKVKTGQGLATDRSVLSEIRSAVGHDAALFADSNGAGRTNEIVESSKMLADQSNPKTRAYGHRPDRCRAARLRLSSAAGPRSSSDPAACIADAAVVVATSTRSFMTMFFAAARGFA